VPALTGATRSYAVAGGVMALFALTVSVISPVRAGLIDRYGPRRTLPPMAVAYALVLACLATARRSTFLIPSPSGSSTTGG
jgi:MFS-type transporter involved in bile tolerance (Atg22 family)